MQSTYDTVVASVKNAIDVGYRHLDTAFIYQTEEGLGVGLKSKIQDGTVTREELFVTTKVINLSNNLCMSLISVP